MALDPNVVMALLKITTDCAGGEPEAIQKTFNMICDLYKREIGEETS